jgi:DNA-binding PadR family transcriptional regulator
MHEEHIGPTGWGSHRSAGRGPRRAAGGGGWGGPPWGGHRERRTRRGEIRTGLLTILAEGPGHGYELIQRIEEKTGGAWKPSPGSVYPTLQMLEDEGLVTVVERDGKRVYELTDEGRAEAERRVAEGGGNPWTREGRGRAQVVAILEAMKQIQLAVRQFIVAGNNAQMEAATEILREARKKLYQLLATSD